MELPVEGVIAGVRVQGIVDLLDMEGRIIDCKTAARRPAGITPEYNLQLTTYSMITPGASVFCRLDTVTRPRWSNWCSRIAKSDQKNAGMRRRFTRWYRRPCGTGSIPRAAEAVSVLAAIAGTGANASENLADESTSERA